MQNTNDPVEIAEGRSPNNQEPRSKNRLVPCLIGLIVLGAVGYGGWYLGKLQNPNISAPGGSDSVGKSQSSNIQTPTTPVVTPTPTKSSQPPEKKPVTDEVINIDLPKSTKTYSGEYYGMKYNFQYDNTFTVVSPYEEEVKVKTADGKEVLSVGFSACSVPNNYSVGDYNTNLLQYNVRQPIKLPSDNGCVSVVRSDSYVEKANYILSTFRFTK